MTNSERACDPYTMWDCNRISYDDPYNEGYLPCWDYSRMWYMAPIVWFSCPLSGAMLGLGRKAAQSFQKSLVKECAFNHK